MADNWQLKAVLSANAQGMIKALGDVGKMAKNTRKYLSDIGGAAGNLGQQLALPSGLIGTLLAGFSGVAVKNAMLGLTDLEDEVSKFAATTGIAGAEFKRFQYLAQLSNVPFESLTASMGKLNKQIYDAANGKGKDLAGLFARLRIEMRDSNGQLRSAADMLPELADAFQRNENPVVRARMGMALFGKSWQELMPLLAEGSDKINERMARFRELGLEVKDVEAFDRQMDAAGAFGDKLDDLSFVAKGFQNTIASGLLPVITPLIDELIKWVVVNKDLVAGEVKTFVTDLATSLRGTDWAAVSEGARSFARGLGWVVDMLGGARNALIALVILINMQTIVAFGSLVAALWRAGAAFWGMASSAIASSGALGMASAAIRAVGVAIMTTPLGIVLALAGAALLVWQNWDKLKAWFSSFFDWIGDKFQSLLGWAVDLAKAAASIFGTGGGMDYRQVAGTAIGPSAQGGAMARPALTGAQQVRASGQIDINIVGAPPGTRVEQVRKTGDVPIRVDVGTRSYALGTA